MRFRIKHTTRFDYDSPAYDSHNELRMCPWNRNGQRCLQFELKSEPAGAILAFDDFYGNQGHSLSVADPHDALAITATSTVEIANPDYLNYPDVPFSRFLSGDGERGNQFYEFLAQSRYIPFSERLRKFFWNGARPRGSDDVAEYVMRVVCYVRDQFEYETTKTHVHSSLNEILKSGGGVCQDCDDDSRITQERRLTVVARDVMMMAYVGVQSAQQVRLSTVACACTPLGVPGRGARAWVA